MILDVLTNSNLWDFPIAPDLSDFLTAKVMWDFLTSLNYSKCDFLTLLNSSRNVLDVIFLIVFDVMNQLSLLLYNKSLKTAIYEIKN